MSLAYKISIFEAFNNYLGNKKEAQLRYEGIQYAYLLCQYLMYSPGPHGRNFPGSKISE